MFETPNEKLRRSATSRPAAMAQNPSRPLRPSSSRSNVLAAFKPPRDDPRAESCAAPAPADIGVNAQWAVKEHTSRKESPPDRFRRKLGFEGCTWRTAAHTAQAEALRITKFRASLCDGRHDDGLDDGFDDGLDDRHQTLMPSRDRENAGRARVGDTHTAEFKSLSHRRSMEVAVAQEAGAREANARSRGSRVAPISRAPFSSSESSMASLACPASCFSSSLASSSWASSHSTLPRKATRARKATASEAAKNTRQTRRESRTARPGRELRRAREQEIAEQPTFALSSVWNDYETESASLFSVFALSVIPLQLLFIVLVMQIC